MTTQNFEMNDKIRSSAANASAKLIQIQTFTPPTAIISDKHAKSLLKLAADARDGITKIEALLTQHRAQSGAHA